MHPAPRILTLALFAAAAVSAHGALTTALDPLAAELRIREAGLVDATDMASIRQLRVVRRSIDVIAASGTLSGDARALALSSTLIARAFRTEFIAPEPAAPELAADMSDFVGDAFQRLSDEVFRRRDDLAARIEGLPEPAATRARRLLERADMFVWRPFLEGNFRRQALAFARAAIAIERGMAVPEEDPVKDPAGDGTSGLGAD